MISLSKSMKCTILCKGFKMKKRGGEGVYTISSVVKDVVGVLNKVTDLYCVAKYNKKITKILIERIVMALSALSILRDDNSYDSKYYANLQILVQVLQDMRKYSEDITQYDSNESQ